MLVDWDLVRSYTGLLSLATFCVFVGAHASLPVSGTSLHGDCVLTICSQKGRVRDKKRDDDDSDDEAQEDEERMSMEDAWLFPIVRDLSGYQSEKLIREGRLEVGHCWDCMHLCGTLERRG